VPITDKPGGIEQSIATFSPVLPLLVAFSGGADSTALLLACHRKWPGQVTAIHIHHGLQAAADEFVIHCQQICNQWGIALHVVYLDARHAKGQSPEEAARHARYEAIAQWAASQNIVSIALAQHQDDQVETFLLALSRGAGLPGLSGMAPAGLRKGSPGLVFYRPLLDLPASRLRDWLAVQGIPHVEDPSNQNTKYTRNRIRHQLMPTLQQCFPSFRSTFTRSARHMAQAQELLHEVAQQDLQRVGMPPRIEHLQQLTVARQANVLRYWLTLAGGQAPSTRQLGELQHQISACTTRGHNIAIKVGKGQVVRKGPVLHWYNP
jgi:tRNA(Ile)-lysidine synthase